MNAMDEILSRLPERLSTPLKRCRSMVQDKANELVLRAEKPVTVYCGRRCYYVTEGGTLTDSPHADGMLTTSMKELDAIVLRLCDYSLYAYQGELNSGYITIGAGVRVGLCGHAVMNGGEITNIRDIGTLNFRFAREIKGCAVPLLQKIEPLDGVLICGAPASGKTTLIRDIARLLSYRYRVSVLDERGELSAFSRGKCSFDTGFCDIFSGYRKGDAALSAIRSMSPDIIICDEMGDRTDAQLLQYTLRCGVSFIATVHASSMDDLRSREVTAAMINTGAFRYIAFLSGKGEVGGMPKLYEMSDVRR